MVFVRIAGKPAALSHSGRKPASPWQNYGVPERHDPARIANDLIHCRQRGLDALDRKTGNQQPVQADALQALADDYITSRHLVAPGGRISQIKTLLRDGIEELSRQGHMADADLLRILFFGEVMSGPIGSPGELLRIARRHASDISDVRFRERRTTVMRSFAQFLVAFASAAPPGQNSSVPTAYEGVEHLAVTGYVSDNAHFIQLLADAVSVTIVGITNERLKPMLEEALRRKRSAGRPDAFWTSLRIVFLAEDLLGAVNDEREELRDPAEVLNQRRQEAIWARRSIGVFLKRTQSSRWQLFEYPYLPAVSGALCEFADGRKTAHLLIRRPRRPTADHIYIDLDDTANQFSTVFEGIVSTSQRDTMIVPVGVPSNGRFTCNTARLQATVLREGGHGSGWLPMVLVITSQRRGAQMTAILQVRISELTTREEYRLAHLGGHILQQDVTRAGGRLQAEVPKVFGLTDEIPVCAAQRLVVEVTGTISAPTLQPAATSGYLYSDKEHLFFFIYSLELPEEMAIVRRAEMHPFALADIVAIRANQVLRSAAQLCRIAEVSSSAWRAATEMVALNLTLHDHVDLAAALVGLPAGHFDERVSIANRIDELVVDWTVPSWTAASREMQVEGLAGLQFREFFSVLLPIYVRLGITGSADLHERISADAKKSAARDRLAELYQDEHLMALMPMEL